MTRKAGQAINFKRVQQYGSPGIWRLSRNLYFHFPLVVVQARRSDIDLKISLVSIRDSLVSNDGKFKITTLWCDTHRLYVIKIVQLARLSLGVRVSISSCYCINARIVLIR